jgi:dihydrofolate synthase/folylpolyglutamate synthase
MTVAMAFDYFARQKVDVAIIEVGLGGRLDSTNIITPCLSIITNIAFDHTALLGNTLAQIAGEKAGIIKPGIPAVTATDVPEALEVIQATARRLDAPLRVITRDQCDMPPLDRLALPLAGAHQRLNAALALAALAAVRDRLPIAPETIVKGLSQVRWPGRFHVMRKEDRTFVLDGAHNLAGAGCLRAALAERFPRSRPSLILGILRDKDWTHMCDLLAPLGDQILLVPVGSERTAPPEALADACRHAHPQADVRACANLDEAFGALAPGALVVVAGSLYLVGEALQRLGEAPDPILGRALNEWQGAAHIQAPATPPAPG